MSVRALKALTFALCLLPMLKMGLDLAEIGGGTLGANPVEALLHRFGWWGLVLLLVTLAVTPLRNLTGQVKLIRLRRMLGLFAFTYISLHFVVYAWLDQRLDVAAIFEDIVERPYITIGMAALLLLIPLAITSTDGMRRRLKKRWDSLHRLVYAIAILGVWHFWWQVKQDILEPLIFAAVLAILLGYRLWRRRRRRQATASA